MLYTLYAIVIGLFLRVFYYQFRLILHIWRFIYDTCGLAIWKVFTNGALSKDAFATWRTAAPVATLRAKLRRAVLHLAIGFVLFFAFTLTSSLTAPHLLERGLFAQ